MVADKGIATELVAVCGEGALVLLERTVAVRTSNGLHGLEVLAGILDCLLGGHELVDVVYQVEHNLAEQHVLEGGLGTRALVLGVIAVEGLDEVGECGVEVLVFGMEHTALHIEVGLQQRRCVHAGGACTGTGQGGAGLGDVAQGVVDSGFEELDFDEAQLIVETLEFTEKAVDEGEGVVVRQLRHVEGDEADFEVLALERSALCGGPFDAVLGYGDFDVGAVGNLFE